MFDYYLLATYIIVLWFALTAIYNTLILPRLQAKLMTQSMAAAAAMFDDELEDYDLDPKIN